MMIFISMKWTREDDNKLINLINNHKRHKEIGDALNRTIKSIYCRCSKLCNKCGYKNINLKLSDREWICSECNTVHDRDLNASINILKEGLRILNISETKPEELRIIDKSVPIRYGELTPIESSGYTLEEIGISDLVDFSKFD